jgi:dienelactone hydrolase
MRLRDFLTVEELASLFEVNQGRRGFLGKMLGAGAAATAASTPGQAKAFWDKSDDVERFEKRSNSNVKIPLTRKELSETGPTIILAHGCNGITQNQSIQDWASLIRKWGYNTVTFDSFSPRGHGYAGGICHSSNLMSKDITHIVRAADVDAIASWIIKQPWHRGKIGLIGWSHGGTTAIETAYQGLPRISACVAYYPQCTWYMNKKNPPKIPLQVHIGDKDTVTTAASCMKVADNVGNDFRKGLFVYADAYHSFDQERIWKAKDIETTTPDGSKFTWRNEYHQKSAESAAATTKNFFETLIKS